MATKAKTIYICSQCGAESAKWAGRCPGCGEWNTMVEEIAAISKPSVRVTGASGVATASKISDIIPGDEFRYVTGVGELDRVLGGGLVKGSLVLLSGDPGIGKSTLLMQICGKLGQQNKILYVSGEESQKQLKMRAERLDVSSDNLYIMTQTDMENICEYIRTNTPDIVMVDSIQTMSISALTSAAGSVTQVRECTAFIQRVCKGLDIPVILVGHVNKDGAIAGPKVMEHIVDAVLYFEGERNHAYRILRAVKNRYGSTNEIGVFEMRDTGLAQVDNPSMMLLSGRIEGVSGTCVACVMEGSRPIMAEVQGLVSTTGFGNPRRMSTGFDYNRLNLLLAVLEKRMGFYFSSLDAYLNVVGGLRLDEPSADLAVALSLISGLKDKAIPADTVVFGEVGLSGEVRSVPRAASRVAEAARLGFTKCILPAACVKSVPKDLLGRIELIGVRTLRDAMQIFA